MKRRELKKAIRKFSHKANFFELGLVRKLLIHREKEEIKLRQAIPKIKCPNCGKTNIIIDDDGSEYVTEEFLVCDSCEDTFDDIYGYIDAVRSYDSLIWSYLVEVEIYFADVDINSYKWQNTCRKLIIEELQR